MKRATTSSSFPSSPTAVKAAIGRARKRVRDPNTPYDPNDRAAVDAFWAKATVRRPGQRGPGKKPAKALLSLRVDPAVIDRWKATGPGWQTRMAETLAKAL
ncbi:MAG: BrnA antitoxin family protein [Nevskiales bacterium]